MTDAQLYITIAMLAWAIIGHLALVGWSIWNKCQGGCGILDLPDWGIWTVVVLSGPFTWFVTSLTAPGDAVRGILYKDR